MTPDQDRALALPPGQFRIRRRSAVTGLRDPSIRMIELGDLILEVHPALPVTAFEDGPTGVDMVLLGTAFDMPASALVDHRIREEIRTAQDPEAAIERCYERLGGSFILIIRVDGRYFLYLDAGGSLSVVYSSERQMAGATAAALLSPTEYKALFRDDLYETLGIAREGWFPSGLTAHRGLARLLCNHRLDLETMVASRHWPRVAPIRAEDAEPLVKSIAVAIRTNIELLVDRLNAALSITGGSDSRTLLSLARTRRDVLLTYTVDGATPNTAMDVALAKRLTALAGVKHAVLTVPAVDQAAIEEWRHRCGHAVGGDNGRLHVALRGLEGSKALIVGTAAETARAFFWKASDRETTVIDAEALCGRFGMTVCDETLSATRAWLTSIPEGDAFFVLDLAYLELRVSPWAYAQSYADPPTWQFHPFATRAVVSRVLQLPVAFKRADLLNRALIAGEWPELLEIPFNKYGDRRDLFDLMRKVSDVSRVTKKLRKMLAR